MNTEIQDVSPSRKTLVVTLDASEVDGENRGVVAEIARMARLPGFRPGKAPLSVVEKRFAKEIREELKGKVVSRAYRDGLEQAKLDVLTIVSVEEGSVQAGQPATVTFTVDLRPAFELPEYKGLRTELPPTDPTEAEIDAVVEGLRRERADFRPVERPARQGDYVRLGYDGRTAAGQPIAELVPDRAIFGRAPQTWEEVGGGDGLIPGLAAQLAGLAKGDKRDISVTFPEGFQIAALAGQHAVYAVEVQEVRERVLPELDEAFFKSQQVEGLPQLRENIARSLKARKEMENRASQRRQISEALAAKVDFPVPESLVESETQALLRQFIEDNLRRGAAQEDFERHKEELYASARRTAAGRAKVQLILARIAEQEKITVEDADIERYLRSEAFRSGQRPDKLAKELGKDRNRVRALQQSILLDKALDFLVAQATVVPVQPATA